MHSLFDFIVTVALSNDLFTPDIIIPGAPSAGGNFNISCRLDGVVERLVGTPTVSLVFANPPGGAERDLSQDGLAYIRPRIFHPGKTSDAGNYTCVAAVIILSIGDVFGNTASEILQIQSNVTANLQLHSVVMLTNCFYIQFLLPSSPSPSHPPPLHCMSVPLLT